MSEDARVSMWEMDRIVCRHLQGVQTRWTLREEAPKYAPDRTCDVEHLRLDLAPDLPSRSVDAVCTQRLRAAYGPFDTIVLDAVDLTIHSIRDGSGRDLKHNYLDRKLTVHFPEKILDTADVVIRYRVDHPALGLYFFGPSETEPDATWQLWSQGEDEEARYWIPCHDAPNEKMTTEVVVAVDPQYSVISNGALISETERKGKKVYHFVESVPHVSYLITLVVGVFERVVDEWRGIPVDYFVEPGRREEALRSFEKTPRMIDFFSSKLDYPYPYEKYTQVAIRHFHFGGMENTSATSQTDGTLHDERAALDFTSDELVAHELAHQWFGDLLTCKSWAHAWLNEGFATYFEALWKEEDLGRDEFDFEMLQNAASYMSEPYRRSIVSNRYAYPHDLFDLHLYPKGGWVLHMLRRELGDDLFWKAMRIYVHRFEKGVVETIDLIRAFEDASGRNLTGFFDQWVMGPGHPEFEGSLLWEEKEGWVKLSLRQTQKAEGGIPAAFRVPIRVECRMPDGRIVAETFEMEHPEQTFYLAVAGRPATVMIDPDLAILGTWKVSRPVEWLEAALIGKQRERRIGPRIEAVRQAGLNASWKAEQLLAKVLLNDPFWGVQAEAARALSRIRTPHALEILLSGVDVEHPKARRAIVIALGAFHSDRAAEALRLILIDGDASYFVEAAAASSLGRTMAKGAVDELRRIIGRPSWHDILAMSACEGLSATRDESIIPDLLSVALDRKRYWNCRLTAIRALGDLGSARPTLGARIFEEISRFLEDPEYLVASRTPQAIVTLGLDAGTGALRRAANATPDPRLAHSYLLAAESLSSQRKRGEDVDRLRDEVEKLRSESKEMCESIRRLEEKGTPAGSKAKARSTAGQRSAARSRHGRGEPSGKNRSSGAGRRGTKGKR